MEKEFKTLEDEANKEAYMSSLADDEEYRMGWDGDWSKVIDQYDGTR